MDIISGKKHGVKRPHMRLKVQCKSKCFDIYVGHGDQHVRWLGLVTALEYQKAVYPHPLLLPKRVTTKDGKLLRPRTVLNSVFADGDTVIVELRDGVGDGYGAGRPPLSVQGPPSGDDDDEEEAAQWMDDSYGADSHLMEATIKWDVDQSNSASIPVKVVGEYTVSNKWDDIYPQSVYGGPFELPLEPIEINEGQFEWIAVRKSVPGSCTFKFVMEDGKESLSESLPKTRSAAYNTLEFTWDCPIHKDPTAVCVPDTAEEAADEALEDVVDPLLEVTWQNMRLSWLPPDSRECLSDVVREFFAVIRGLFDTCTLLSPELSDEQVPSMCVGDLAHLLKRAHLLPMKLSLNHLMMFYRDTSSAGERGQDALPDVGSSSASIVLSQPVDLPLFIDLLVRVSCVVPMSVPLADDAKPQTDEIFFQFCGSCLVPACEAICADALETQADLPHPNLPEGLAFIKEQAGSFRSLFSLLAEPCDIGGDETVALVRVASVDSLLSRGAELINQSFARQKTKNDGTSSSEQPSSSRTEHQQNAQAQGEQQTQQQQQQQPQPQQQPQITDGTQQPEEGKQQQQQPPPGMEAIVPQHTQSDDLSVNEDRFMTEQELSECLSSADLDRLRGELDNQVRTLGPAVPSCLLCWELVQLCVRLGCALHPIQTEIVQWETRVEPLLHTLMTLTRRIQIANTTTTAVANIQPAA
ncbi:unnamed protein product [Vitrella brassicaformis CCMP3155]|uniref:Uncharacterized protein n=1 Tax=Vitrella brassicaformis (strain CCMP3155) TaxID=1169540 RepID=A0A0G4EH47_VITBC|nr:unnamed protein product [Vitrella brassicaformis CCMP3155]|eukprot:CEL94694.1 unnamed protein product [Vitrella brassicaformis CCMP3155]